MLFSLLKFYPCISQIGYSLMHTPITSADVFCIMLKCRYITQSYVLHFTFHFHQYPNLFYFYNYNLQLLLILLYTNMYKFQTVLL